MRENDSQLVQTTPVSFGPNAGVYYTTGLNARLRIGYNYQPELMGVGSLYSVSSNVAECSGGATSLRVVDVNNCKGLSLGAFEDYVRAHEACHVSESLRYFNLWKNSYPNSMEARMPGEVEVLVAKSHHQVNQKARVLLSYVNTDLEIANQPLEEQVHAPHTIWWPYWGTWALTTSRQSTSCL